MRVGVVVVVEMMVMTTKTKKDRDDIMIMMLQLQNMKNKSIHVQGEDHNYYCRFQSHPVSVPEDLFLLIDQSRSTVT
jgi:hypothetical protein